MSESTETPRAKWSFVTLLRSPRTWALVAILAIAIGAGLVAKEGSADRGLTTEGIWLIEASEQRGAYYAGWFGKEGAPNPKDREVIHRSFAPHAALPPLMPAVIASAKTVGNVNAAPANVATSVNALFFALFVLMLGIVGLEVAGSVGGLTAALGAASVPKVFGLAAMAGFGMSGLFFATLTPILMIRAHRSRIATVGAALALAAAVHTSFIGFFAWMPWLWFAATRPRQPAFTDGYTATPLVPLRTIFVIPVGMVLAFWAYPWLWFDLKDHALLWLTHFLRQPAAPFSYAGEVWGHERIPWHAAPYLVVATTPPTWIFLALAGVRLGGFYERLAKTRTMRFLRYLPWAPETLRPRRIALADPIQPGPQRGDFLRLSKICLVIALALPLLFRSPYFGGLDLLSLSTPWIIILASAGMARLVAIAVDSVPWGRFLGSLAPKASGAAIRATVLTLFVMSLVVPPLLEVVRFHPLHEAYYSWVVGGPEGARLRGLPRYPQGPMPLSLVTELATESEGPIGIGFMLHGRRYDDALNRAIASGHVPENVQYRNSVYDADIAILPHDDLNNGYERAVTDFYRTVNNQKDFPVVTYSRGKVPIFSATVVPR